MSALENRPPDDAVVAFMQEPTVVPHRQNKFPYKCDKCGATDYTQGQSISAGGFLSKILNIQTRKFVTITCNHCGHTELYERYQNPIANILDIFIR